MKIRGSVEVINLTNGSRQFRVTGDGENRFYELRTAFVNPPISYRSMDWQAWLDGCEECGPCGSGPSEAEAIYDLKETIESA